MQSAAMNIGTDTVCLLGEDGVDTGISCITSSIEGLSGGNGHKIR